MNYRKTGGLIAKIKRMLTRTTVHFQDGARVEIVGHWGWPDGTKGTIAPFPSIVREMASSPPCSPKDFAADGLLRRIETETGIHFEQWIELDVPTDDGSGHGPYRSTSVSPKYLRRLD
jgi:hypothetical protein